MPRLSGLGSLGPPPSLAKKRTYDDLPTSQRDRDRDRTTQSSRGALGDSDEEEEPKVPDQSTERAPPKPTLHLSSMPPGTSAAVVRNLIPSKLKVEGVRFLPSSDQAATERRSASAIVVLAAETTSTEIDTAVSALQKTYMGWGFYLSISRHVSTNALGLAGVPPPPIHHASNMVLPFGAKPKSTAQPIPTGPMNRAPPPGSFAPPPSYGAGPPGALAGAPAVQVHVSPPSDLNQLKLIHKTVEALIKNGPEFEAVLMNRPDVQKEQKWAWIWDSTSVGGIWYRWKLWTLYNQLELDGSHRSDEEETKKLRKSTQRIFEGSAPWVRSDTDLKFEFLDEFEDIITDSEYDSEEMNSDDEEDRRRKQTELTTLGEPEGPGYLNPLEKAKLTHLLVRLPKTTGTLRRGDIARITAFAINHASSGFEEVVEMLVSNILRPYNWASAGGEKSKADIGTGDEADRKQDSEDPSYGKLIGLYTISDILSTASTAGVRHAWRYRTAFEAALKDRKVFEQLGRLDKDLGWGRMRTDRWRNSVDAVLRKWHDVNLFMEETHEYLAHAFANPPLTEAEKAAESSSRGRDPQPQPASITGKEELVKTMKIPAGDANTKAVEIEGTEVAPLEGPEGVPMSDLEGEPMSDSDEDVGDASRGQPGSSDMRSEPHRELEGSANNSPRLAPNTGFSMSMSGASTAQNIPAGPRRRPRAEDLFGADKD
jgi:U2-associated protein SR140